MNNGVMNSMEKINQLHSMHFCEVNSGNGDGKNMKSRRESVRV